MIIREQEMFVFAVTIQRRLLVGKMKKIKKGTLPTEMFGYTSCLRGNKRLIIGM